MPLDALVPLHDLLRVDGQLLVRVNDDAEQPRVRLQKSEQSERVRHLLLSSGRMSPFGERVEPRIAELQPDAASRGSTSMVG